MKNEKINKKEIESVKKTILTIVFMAFSIFITQGQTPPTEHTGDVILRTQTQVDAFNHSSISGDLDIGAGPTDFIMNLNGLSSLTSVGRLIIGRVQDLTSLSGLENLTSIGGLLFIVSNRSLTSLTGLESLSSIGGKLYIGRNAEGNTPTLGNPALVDFCAISGLVTNAITDGTGTSTNEYFVTNNAYNPTYVQIKNTTTCSLAGSILSKIYTYSGSGGGSSDPALTILELNNTGVTGIVAASLAAYNTAIKAKANFTDPATSQAATLAELQTLIISVNLPVVLSKIYTYSASGSGGSSGSALTLSELNGTGITSIIAANLAAYNVAILAKANFANPTTPTNQATTLSELQTLITSVNRTAIFNKVYTYSASGTGGSSGMTLTLEELNTIGITGAIAINLDAYNAAIKKKANFTNPETSQATILTELQALITDVNGPVVGLFDYSSKSLVRLSPNPAIGFVRFFGLSSEEGYVIYNTLGVAVQSGIVFSEEKIIIESLHAGLYFLKLGKLEVFKFLKQ